MLAPITMACPPWKRPGGRFKGFKGFLRFEGFTGFFLDGVTCTVLLLLPAVRSQS